MESGSPPNEPERGPGREPKDPGEPAARPPDPQSPAPGPQQPPPPGPQSPAPGPPPPPGPQAPPGWAPPGPQAPAPEGMPGGYGGPVPPGGWQTPAAPAAPAFAGAQLAGWGSRAGALLLDALVITACVILLVAPGVALIVADSEGIGIGLLILGGLAAFLVSLLYASFFLQRPGERNGQTLGKQWVGIRVVRDDGQPMTWGSALLRELVVRNLLFGWVGGFFLSIPTLLDYLWPLWDDQNRTLHDMIVKTHVVRA